MQFTLILSLSRLRSLSRDLDSDRLGSRDFERRFRSLKQQLS